MAGKKVKNEVEAIRNELKELTEAVWAIREHVTVESAANAASLSTGAARGNGRGYDAAGRTAALEEKTYEESGRGYVSTYGYYESPDGAGSSRSYRWALEEQSAESLLAIDEDDVTRILSAIGHRQRLAILKAILVKPSSAAELVASLELGTTGAAYHHLNVLQAADLVRQEERGVFVVTPHHVSSIFSMLAGIASVANTTFTEHPSDDNDSESADSENENEARTDANSSDALSKRGKRKAA